MAIQLPLEVRGTLSSLRQAIRRYVLWEGLALVLLLCTLLFWGSWLTDWLVFSTTRLELPRWLRATFSVVAVSLVAASALHLIGLRMFRSLSLRSLALLLERRYPELSDRLVTATEAAAGNVRSSSFATEFMLTRTIEEAAAMTRTLSLADVFDARPLRRALITAGVLVSSILGLAVVDAQAMQRWVNGFVSLKDEYWNRQTVLKVQAALPPGESLRDFKTGTLRHARGADLALVVSVLPGKTVPSRVRLDYRLGAGRGAGRAYLTAGADGVFRHTLPELIDSTTFWVTGGDYSHAEPYRVITVPSPTLDRLVLQTRYLPHTGLNLPGETSRTPIPAEGLQLSLPVGSDLIAEATFSQPLSEVRWEAETSGERFEVHVAAPPAASTADQTGETSSSVSPEFSSQLMPDRQTISGTVLTNVQGTLQARTAEHQYVAPISAAWSADRRTVSLHWKTSEQGLAELLKLLQAAQPAKSQLPLNNGSVTGDPLQNPLPCPADVIWRVYSVDTEGIASLEPARVVFRGIPDAAPVVETELQGISPTITRQARIPVAGRITDDYGLETARFEFLAGTSEEWKSRELSQPPAGQPREFQLARTPTQAFERFDVLPLDLSVGQMLTLSVVAVDGDLFTGPQTTRSQKHLFRIVTVEELLSQLYARELNLRRRFEQLLEELKSARESLESQRPAAQLFTSRRSAGGSAASESEAGIQGLSAAAERALYGIRQNATEAAGIAAAFKSIREELVNNAADTPQMLERIDFQILRPLGEANEYAFPAIDASLGLLKLACDKQSEPLPPLDATLAELNSLITRLEQVLLEMRKLETFHEALELLKGIISAQEELEERTRSRRKAKAIEALE